MKRARGVKWCHLDLHKLVELAEEEWLDNSFV